jgi:NADH-quinone oxidoreductase subunit G
VVWLPSNSAGRSVTRDLHATAGGIVKIGTAYGSEPGVASTVSPERAPGTAAAGEANEER